MVRLKNEVQLVKMSLYHLRTLAELQLKIGMEKLKKHLKNHPNRY